MALVSGGELAIRTLVAAGVTDVFALYGGHLEALFQACRRHDISVTDMRHEAAAGHAAEGYARSRRGLGVAFVTAGPGLTNAVTSIANAYLDRTPVLYITASAPLSSTETNVMQGGFDQIELVRPITKWAQRVTAPQDIPRLLAHAIRIATSEPTGPVVLELPIDVSLAPVDEEAAPIPATIMTHRPVPPRADQVAQAAALLAGAQRPVIMGGEGVWKSGASDALRRFAEASGIPTFLDHEAHGALPASHPLYAGRFYAMSAMTEETGRPDVVLALGTRFGVFTLGRSDRLVPFSAQVIQVDVDAKELGRVRDVALPIAADSRELLEALIAHMGDTRWPDHHRWRGCLRSIELARPDRFADLAGRNEPRMHPYAAVAAIVGALDEETILIGDGAEAAHWLIDVVRQERPGAFFTHGHFGALGMGLGLSIGVQVANRGKRILLVTGDGGVGINIAEFDSMVRHGLPVVTVVLNNRAWGATRHFQDLLSGPGNNIATDLGEARYDQVAEGFGCAAFHLSRPEDVGPAIRAAFETGTPACVNVEIDQAPTPPESEIMMSYM